MKGLLIAVVFLTLSGVATAPAAGAGRYPEPDFESGYVIPTATTPAPNAPSWEYLHLVVLAAVLAVTALLVLKVRYRAGVYILMIVSLAYFGFWRQGCICPVGSQQNVILGISDSSYTVPIFVIGFFFLPLVTAVFFGRVFCGAVCPLGAVQDVVALRPVRIPEWLEHALRMVPYVILSLMVLFVATGAGFIVCRYDPFIAFFRLSGSAFMVTVGAVFLIAGIFVARPYCRFLCPYAVLLSWGSRLSWLHATITPDECVKCRLCENACPFGAIQKPTPERIAEPRERGVKRLALLSLLLPLIVAAGMVAGWYAGTPLSRAHKTVYTAEQVYMEEAGLTDQTTLESEAFAAAGRPAADLYEDAEQVRGRFRRGGALAGAFLGVVFGMKMLSLSIYRQRDDYEINKAWCLSCARCFNYCPREQARRSGPREQDE